MHWHDRNTISPDVNQTGAEISTSKGPGEPVAETPASETHAAQTQPTETSVVDSSQGESSAQDSTTVESSSSGRSLDEAARTINAATGSAIALNTLDHRDAGATKSSNQNDANRNNVNNKSPKKADQSLRILASPLSQPMNFSGMQKSSVM
jgi:hypothetical protein